MTRLVPIGTAAQELGVHPAKAHLIVKTLFEAAECFVYQRLPESYAGQRRDKESFPVQYLGVNVPQAWASGAVVQSISLLLGLTPKVSEKILQIFPHLPEPLECR